MGDGNFMDHSGSAEVETTLVLHPSPVHKGKQLLCLYEMMINIIYD